MIRSRENPVAIQAGALSVLVHAVLLSILVLSFNWRTVRPASVAEVELWDNLPQQKAVEQPVEKPVEKEVPPEPPKPVEQPKPEPKPEPVVEPKPDIQMKKVPVKEVHKVEKPIVKPEPPKPDAAKKADAEKKRQDAIRQLQEMVNQDSKPAHNESPKNAGPNLPAANSVSQGDINKYMAIIGNQIRRHVNPQLCGSGRPELTFHLELMPTGELIGAPKLLSGSGISLCDDAVMRAILLAAPLAVPTQSDLFSQFRSLDLKFRPNDQ